MNRNEVLALNLATSETDEVLTVLNLAEAHDQHTWTAFVPLRAKISRTDADRISELIAAKLGAVHG
jgi:hypothetical protein